MNQKIINQFINANHNTGFKAVPVAKNKIRHGEFDIKAPTAEDVQPIVCLHVLFVTFFENVFQLYFRMARQCWNIRSINSSAQGSVSRECCSFLLKQNIKKSEKHPSSPFDSSRTGCPSDKCIFRQTFHWQ